jgi:hypothetical protein
MFLQCLTEWVFRHLPLYYVFHVMLGVLMSLYYIKRHTDKARLAEQSMAAEPIPATVETWPTEPAPSF